MVEMVHPADKGKAQQYLSEMLSGNSNSDTVSPIYRLRVSNTQDKYVHVQTKSKFFKCANSSEPDFVMVTHSIINDKDVAVAEANPPHSSGGVGSNNGGSVGGPLMASVNGSTRQLSDANSQISLNTSSYTSFTSTNVSDLNYDFIDFPTSTLGELGIMPTEERITWERPESRHSTPAPSPHPSFAQTQPSPYQSSITFPFSPIGDQPPPLEETKDRREQAVSDNGASEGDSARLRMLLMNKRPSVDSDDGGGGGGGGGGTKHHPVLKGLLNSEDEEDTNKNQAPSSDPPTSKVSGGNNMLLKVSIEVKIQ